MGVPFVVLQSQFVLVASNVAGGDGGEADKIAGEVVNHGNASCDKEIGEL